MRARIAWALVVVSALCGVADTAIIAVHAPLLSHDVFVAHGWPLVTIATFGSALMGAMIVSRYPNHPIGWLLVITGMSSISAVAESYNFWPPGGTSHTALLAGRVVGWGGAFFGAPIAITAVMLILLIAPNRRLPSVAARCVAACAIVGAALYLAGLLSLSPTQYNVNDLGPSNNGFTAVAVWFATISLIGSAVVLLARLLQTQGEPRRQLLWMTGPAVVLAGTYSWLLMTAQFDFSAQSDFSSILLYVAYISVPLCTGVAVLRHRLVDIDVIVSRTLVVFIATALIGATYVLIVVTLGSIIPGHKGVWPTLPAMAIVALAFQPLRLWVVRVADRLAFGAAAEPYDALADFSRRLGDSPDPSDLLPAVAEAAADAVRARRVTVTMALPFGDPETATVPAGSVAGTGPSAHIAIQDGTEELGFLTVEMAPGHGLRSRDLTLLRDLADQAVVAFRNARLSAELSQRVVQLDLQASALDASRRRLITAGDAERSRLERAVTREVAPHLQTLPEQLERLARGEPGPVTAESVQQLRAQAEAALESLREITRGVYPAQLSRSGLESALRSLLARAAGTTFTSDIDGDAQPLDPRVEAAAYFCVAEAVRALGGPLTVSLNRCADELQLVVAGRADHDLPFDHMNDRAEAVGGTISTQLSGGLVSLDVRLPATRSLLLV